MIASDLAASSAGVAATVAPASASGLVLSADRFQTVTLCPTSISRERDGRAHLADACNSNIHMTLPLV